VTFARGRSGRALAGIVGALTFWAPESVLLTVRQADPYATPNDLVAAAVSADGRYVAFASFARLVPRDTNDRRDIYVLDRFSGTVTIESLSPEGLAMAQDSVWPRINGDGRLVVYEAMQDGPDHLPLRVIALRDRWRATTTILQNAKAPLDRSSREPAISGDGRVVVFSSCATNLTDDTDANGAAEDVYAFDTSNGRFERINVGTDGRQPLSGASFGAVVSADGRYVAFTSTSDLDSSSETAQRKPPGVTNVYLRDIEAHVTRRISVGRDGRAPNGPSYGAAMSGDGRHVAFVSQATNLVPGDGNRSPDVFLHDVQSRTTILVSRSVSSGSANGPSRNPAVAANGNLVAFQSEASDLTCGGRCPDGARDINLVSDVFLFDRVSGTTLRLSTGRQSWMEPSAGPSISGSGAVVAFSSRHPVDANDTQNDFDLFVWMDQTVSLTYRVPGR
jgi:Tol biopolymer transport system component